MSLLGWIPKCKLLQNKSKRFESRFSNVVINKSNSIMLQNMEKSVLGVWIAHGEGQFKFNQKSGNIVNSVAQYVDDNCIPTQEYPFNPNGSQQATAAICSDNGRHLAMMPHPERSFLQWQLPYKTSSVEKFNKQFTPWYTMFANAYRWCI